MPAAAKASVFRGAEESCTRHAPFVSLLPVTREETATPCDPKEPVKSKC